MKKLFFTLLVVFTVLPVFGQMKLDTLYYDKNWKIISTPAFASYYRVMEKTTDTTHAKPYRGYYISGASQAEGEYISFDKNDDTKSVYDGDYELFYKSGKTSEKGSWANGKREGEFTTYNEDGLIVKHLYYSDGELNGVCTEFNEDGTTCVQTEYSNGQPCYDYYVMSNQYGQCSMISLTDGKPIYENPSPSDVQVEYIDDLPWITYNKNGVSIGMNLSNKDYYRQVSIIIANNSMFPIDIGSDNISGIYTSPKGKEKALRIRSFTEYSQKLQQDNAWNKFFAGIGEYLSTKNVGTSVSQTTSAYGGTTGSGRTYSGATASVTTSYDATAAYQARITASNRMTAYGEALDADRKVREEGYLKRTTLHPGETIIGYVVTAFWTNNGAAGIYAVDVDINGVIYPFRWEIRYEKHIPKVYPLTE
ncbi:MAG: hypothetical protein LUC26_05905 [Prevotella sp.]|nr:hypothetical protein [Prevotella sp.]